MDKKEREESAALAVDFDKRDGLVPCVVQDVADGKILMLAYVNAQALDTTFDKGMATFWSTSRDELWTKGETSGDFLQIVEVLTDCDQDALVYRVIPRGAGACHTKDPASGIARSSCFYRKVNLEHRSLQHC
ncbi:MAG: phosphoribosyl-AMP cyclohydrolase [Halieaceae bacterium]|jgi:phosphoribosyl-AMP cyclohydrolase|nr:phosphoribosyl-AMP cyclohydrolase [Halieaceae bacterium]